MKESYLLKLDEAVKLLCDAAEARSAAVVSYLKEGKWQLANAALEEVADNGILIVLTRDTEKPPVDFPVNQPVGMSLKFENIKYIFETRVTDASRNISADQAERYMLALPDRIEMMQRRAYNRIPIPKATTVAVTFWHRGYNDSRNEAPAEDYWEANMVDLSAGGLMMSIKDDNGRHFRENQYLGLQFTPMCYQKPLTLEGKINRLERNDRSDNLKIAVEFLGLEASSEGREKLHRLISIVNTYSMQNKCRNAAHDEKLAANEAASAAEADTEVGVHQKAAEFAE